MKKLVSTLTTALIVTLALTAFPALAEDGEKARSQVVNVNEAGASELALLPRVGPALAARIIEYREENGQFEQPEDLLLVRGIGEKTFAMMEPFVAVSGATTLAAKIRVSDLKPSEE